MRVTKAFVVGALLALIVGLWTSTTTSAQAPMRIYGTVSGKPIALLATAGGVLRVSLDGGTVTSPLVLPSNGTATATVLNFGTPGTGLYGDDDDVILSSAGTARLRVVAGQTVIHVTDLFGWGSSGVSNQDVFLSREAAQTLQLGQDAAGVANQILKAADRITSDGVGAALTITGGRNRGASAGGHIIFQTSPAAGAGVAGTLTTALTITDSQTAVFAGPVVVTNLATTELFFTGANSSNITSDNVMSVTGTTMTLSTTTAGTGTMTFAGNPILMGSTQTTDPTCTANCGTSPSVVGTDSEFTLTMGAAGSPASGFVITFNGTWPSTPQCTGAMALAGMVVGKLPLTLVTTTTTLTVVTNGTAPANSDVYKFICRAGR